MWNTSCTHKEQLTPIPDTSNFPAPISKIFRNKCAISGCHNAASYMNAAQLRLDTWDHLFNGYIYGSAVIPYASQFSPLMYYINTSDANGLVAVPRMPLSSASNPLAALSQDEYLTIKNWIDAGAPDANGQIAFSTNATTRQKIYIAHSSACNQVAVVDAKTKLIMRYIPVGDAKNFAAHDIESSDDGRNVYVPFFQGAWVQKINTDSDKVVGTANVGSVTSGVDGKWSIVIVSPDNSQLLVTGLQANGFLESVNTSDMSLLPSKSVTSSSIFAYPHGAAANATFDTFYASLQNGNIINKYWFISGRPHFKQISVDNKPITYSSIPGITPDPHQIEMSPDYKRYFITCQNTNEVRIMDAKTDTLIKVIPVGKFPQEMTLCESKNLLYVACMQDNNNPNPGCIGSIYIINTNTLNVDKVLYGDFSQPHDMAVDEQDGLLYVLSSNKGGTAHHSSTCGTPGWYTVFDLNTYVPDPRRFEVLENSYTINARF